MALAAPQKRSLQAFYKNATDFLSFTGSTVRAWYIMVKAPHLTSQGLLSDPFAKFFCLTKTIMSHQSVSLALGRNFQQFRTQASSDVQHQSRTRL